MAILIKVDGTITEIQPENGTDFQLEELQKYVGGYIECVYLPNNEMVVCNEEGKVHNFPINITATNRAGFTADVLCGDVVICNQDQLK